MRILLTNDDGYLSPGINELFKSLSSCFEVIMVAPETNMSVSSSSLSIGKSLKVTKVKDNIYHINGTPSDCVHISLCGFLRDKIDLVVSGINDVANCGDDVVYSGTVGGAIEGRFLGVPSISVSMDGGLDGHYETGSAVIGEIVGKLEHSSFGKNTILNVNIPNITFSEIKGTKITRLGFRHMSEGAIPDPDNKDCYFIGPVGPEADNGPGTDFHAVSNGFVSITPIGVDLTKVNEVDSANEWINHYF